MTLTWQQVAVFSACLAAVVFSHKFLGVDNAMVTSLVATIIAGITRSPVIEGETKAK